MSEHCALAELMRENVIRLFIEDSAKEGITVVRGKPAQTSSDTARLYVKGEDLYVGGALGKGWLDRAETHLRWTLKSAGPHSAVLRNLESDELARANWNLYLEDMARYTGLEFAPGLGWAEKCQVLVAHVRAISPKEHWEPEAAIDSMVEYWTSFVRGQGDVRLLRGGAPSARDNAHTRAEIATTAPAFAAALRPWVEWLYEWDTTERVVLRNDYYPEARLETICTNLWGAHWMVWGSMVFPHKTETWFNGAKVPLLRGPWPSHVQVVPRTQPRGGK